MNTVKCDKCGDQGVVYWEQDIHLEGPDGEDYGGKATCSAFCTCPKGEQVRTEMMCEIFKEVINAPRRDLV